MKPTGKPEETIQTISTADGNFTSISSNTKKVDDIIKELERKKETTKFKNLSIVQNINEFIFGIEDLKSIKDKSKETKDFYDVQIQCKMDEENKQISNEEEEIFPTTFQQGHRKSIGNIKTKANFTTVKKTEEDKIKLDKEETGGNEKVNKINFNDELKKQLLQSHELNVFMNKNSRYVERVFYSIIYFLFVLN